MADDDLTGDLAVAIADAVEFTFTVTNTGGERAALEFTSGLTADVEVRRDGEPVWRWSDDRMFTQALSSEPLEPGESTTYDRRWTDPVPGRYLAVATLAAEGADVEARARFEV